MQSLSQMSWLLVSISTSDCFIRIFWLLTIYDITILETPLLLTTWPPLPHLLYKTNYAKLSEQASVNQMSWWSTHFRANVSMHRPIVILLLKIFWMYKGSYVGGTICGQYTVWHSFCGGFMMVCLELPQFYPPKISQIFEVCRSEIFGR